VNQVFEALHYLIRALVDAPQKIAIERIETPKTDIFNISVPPDEMGRLVGRNGRTAEAIRDVLGAIGAIANKEIILDVIEARAVPPPRSPAKTGQPRAPRGRRRGRGRPKQRRPGSSQNAH
jgi:predicted RNA-binding protein YlqC (UPF0109 family)